MMANRRWFASIVIAGILGFLSVTLGASQPQTPSATRNHRLAKPVRTSLVAWGSGHGQVGLRRSPQQPSEGVSSLTIATDGSTLLLDRVNQRVVQLSPSGSITDVWTISPTPPDAEDISSSSDGALGLYSPFRALFWVQEGEKKVAELRIPRELRELTAIDFGPSRLIIARSAHQERYRLGSPSAPQPLAAVFHSKQEGCFALPDGLGVATTLDEHQHPHLLVIESGKPRAKVLRSLPIIAQSVLSARLIGVHDTLVCARLEHKISESPILVRRSVSCLDAQSGAVLFETDLGPVDDLYVPRRSFAMGGASGRLVFIQPRSEGLRVTSWDLPRPNHGGTR